MIGGCEVFAGINLDRRCSRSVLSKLDSASSMSSALRRLIPKYKILDVIIIVFRETTGEYIRVYCAEHCGSTNQNFRH
jgi:hypothetical protein